MTKALLDLLRRVETWPDEAQTELVEIVREIERELAGGVYSATASELAGIDRGLRDSAEGRFATLEQLTSVLPSLKQS